MSTGSIAFVGGGNMASSIVGGLVEAGWSPDCIAVSDPNQQSLSMLRQEFKVQTTSSNAQAVKQAEVVVLAVKPQVLESVCAEVASSVPSNAFTLSIAAGITSRRIINALGEGSAVVRCMPNTPALVKQGASVLYANAYVSKEQKKIAENILRAVGEVTWIEEEELMDAVTAVSGSGPAYFFLVIEAMTEAGVDLGLSADLASSLAVQTALGAASLAKQSEDSVPDLRRKVTSPNGTTAKALELFEKLQLRDIFKKAMTACAQRSKELGNL